MSSVLSGVMALDGTRGAEGMKRTASNISSSSSGIHVASAPSPRPATSAWATSMPPYPYGDNPKPATCQDGMLVVFAHPDKLKAIRDGPAKRDDDVPSNPADALNDEADDGEGPNSRGTYSREYTLRHPEIKWTHRGQGRYLPADEVKKEAPPEPLRRSRHSKPLFQVPPNPLEEKLDVGAAVQAISRLVNAPFEAVTPSSERPPRKRRAIEETLADSLTGPPTYGLRHRNSDVQSPSTTESRAARLARRAKPIPTTENRSRTSLRSRPSYQDNTSEDEREDDDDDMAGDDENGKNETYDKAYVDAHPGEDFYHTGNGWYKKGRRPRKMNKLKHTAHRASNATEDGAVAELLEGQTVHTTQLHLYPGREFTHKGNGYYKAGPDPNQYRSSITAPITNHAGRIVYGDGSGGTVDKAYKEAHPEIEWVHRGNGRYIRKADAVPDHAAASVTPAPTTSTNRRNSEQTYDKAYVIAHPDEEFYHTGNARYKRGPRPSGKKSLFVEDEESEDDEEELPNGLVDRAYVDAHPHLEFHHRGQGRYARGPKPTTTPAPPREEEEESDDDDDDDDPAGLVSTAYVRAHPEQDFYHKGQGRWARGVAPAGHGRKMAKSGPSKHRAATQNDGDEEDLEDEQEEENEVEADKPPPETALVLKSEGPDKYPELEWHYRGGGKWGRITKAQWDAKNRGVKDYKITTVSKYHGKKLIGLMDDGPEAQLEREDAAAQHGTHADDLQGMDVDVAPAASKPKVRRGRNKFARREDQAGSKHTSNSQSQAPTPRPRMLTEEEDVLTEADLPPLYRDDWSPSAETEPNDHIQHALRENFKALNIEAMTASLTKHDPRTRPLSVLKKLSEHFQELLVEMQDEYLELDEVVAPQMKVPRKAAKGGRLPLDPEIFEDRKEADLYDYAFDPRKIGFQDPMAQKIQRDAEGRELRKRRNRSGVEPTETVPGWDFGEGMQLAPKRQSRQPNRFDGVVHQPRKRVRAIDGMSKADSMTPDRATPLGGPMGSNGGYQVPTTGRWAGHVPKRIRELRDESVVSVTSENGTVTQVRKGRPPGSKNLHRRKDAGIKKGPRKPKAVPSIETLAADEDDGEEGEEMEVDA